MASTANEGNIVDFTRRMGGIAPLARISIQEILGKGATLDSLGQTSETSSTALSKLFINMAKNTKEYARFAKMEMADFVNLMNTDANEAFIRVLEGIQDLKLPDQLLQSIRNDHKLGLMIFRKLLLLPIEFHLGMNQKLISSNISDFSS